LRNGVLGHVDIFALFANGRVFNQITGCRHEFNYLITQFDKVCTINLQSFTMSYVISFSNEAHIN